MSRPAIKPTLWNLRKVSTRIGLSMPSRLTRIDTVRLLWNFCFRNHYSIPLSPCDGMCRTGSVCANGSYIKANLIFGCSDYDIKLDGLLWSFPLTSNIHTRITWWQKTMTRAMADWRCRTSEVCVVLKLLKLYFPMTVTSWRFPAGRLILLILTLCLIQHIYDYRRRPFFKTFRKT